MILQKGGPVYKVRTSLVEKPCIYILHLSRHTVKHVMTLGQQPLAHLDMIPSD